MLSTAINQLGARYRVIYSGSPLHIWRIYDLYHTDIRNQHDVDNEVPDSSEAVTILTEDACVELVKTRMHEGLLDMPHDLQEQDKNENESELLSDLRKELEESKTKNDEFSKAYVAVVKEYEGMQQELESAQTKDHSMSRDKLLDTFVVLAEKGELRDDVVQVLSRLA